MEQKKVNVQMLEPQPNDGIRTIDTTSSQTIAKPIVSGSLPNDEEVSQWFEDNIGVINDCSASSAIYKFRLWLQELARQ